MAGLNYHHLLYFWTVARQGSVTRASAELHLTQPTISGQLRALEKSVGAKLFERSGRNLILTPTGRTVYEYADEIFKLGKELQDTLEGRPPGRPLRLVVGIADVLPRFLVYRLLEPVLNLPEPVQVICHDDKTELLLARLALNELDVVLADVPASPLVKVRAFNHLLGECGISFLGTRDLVARYRRGFPRSLDGAPVLLPMEGTALRRSLDQWFDTEGIRPVVRGEFADSDLFDVFAQQGMGIFAIPSAVQQEARQGSDIRLLGRVESIRERFYAISVERRLTHPAVLAISKAARQELFE